MQTCIYTFKLVFLHSSNKYLEVELLDQLVVLFLNFEKSAYCFLQWSDLLTVLLTVIKFPFSPHSYQHLLFLIFFIWAILGCELAPHCGFDSISLMISDDEHFSHVSVDHLQIFFGEVPKVLAHLWIIFFRLYKFSRYLEYQSVVLRMIYKFFSVACLCFSSFFHCTVFQFDVVSVFFIFSVFLTIGDESTKTSLKPMLWNVLLCFLLLILLFQVLHPSILSVLSQFFVYDMRQWSVLILCT